MQPVTPQAVSTRKGPSKCFTGRQTLPGSLELTFIPKHFKEMAPFGRLAWPSLPRREGGGHSEVQLLQPLAPPRGDCKPSGRAQGRAWSGRGCWAGVSHWRKSHHLQTAQGRNTGRQRPGPGATSHFSRACRCLGVGGHGYHGRWERQGAGTDRWTKDVSQS